MKLLTLGGLCAHVCFWLLENTLADKLAAVCRIDANIRGLFNMCAAWLPHLKTKTAAYLINISSGLAFVPLTRIPSYCATKVCDRHARSKLTLCALCRQLAVTMELHWDGSEQCQVSGMCTSPMHVKEGPMICNCLISRHEGSGKAPVTRL